jgi:hypothetical protein
MTTTAESTRTYGLMDRQRRQCQSPVIALQAQGQPGAPECPAFPHLPADIQHALADFDARVADARLPMAADGHPAIPAAAEAWISDFLRSHIPTEF